jgi:ABC-type multidrug transport system ATPase subunit
MISVRLPLPAGRKPQASHEGELRANGHPAWPGGGGDGRLPRLTAYVPQSDVCSAFQTAEEAVRFACALKGDYGYLKPERRREEREHHVRMALDLCGLSGVGATRFGDADGGGPRGISGG